MWPFKKKEPEIIIKKVEVEKPVIVEKPIVIDKEVQKIESNLSTNAKSIIDSLRLDHMMCKEVTPIDVSLPYYREFYNNELISVIKRDKDNTLSAMLEYYPNHKVRIKIKI